MAIVKCSKGHFYDNTRYSQCPHCGILADEDDAVTVSMPSQSSQSDDDKTVALRPVGPAGAGDAAIKQGAGIPTEEDDKTVRLYTEEKGADLIVGWLVCIVGAEKGRDYRLHQGFNRMGRDYQMDIPVMDDKSLGREPVCAVVYDDRTNKFFAVQQQGNVAYLNADVLQGAVELKTGDIISAGKSQFEFIAFCREGRTWENE